MLAPLRVSGLSVPTVRLCKADGCELEALPRRQLCELDWLAKQPPVKRAEAALKRLSMVPVSARRAIILKSEWPKGWRWCAGCQTFMRLRDCIGARCKACQSIASHKSRIKSTFGIDEETYQWLYVQQHGKCAICRQKPSTKRFSVDHEHKHEECGGKGCPKCVRGLLCSRCNHELLGAAHDSLNILRNAVAYMESPPMRGEWSVPQFELDEWERLHPGQPIAPF